ncbi:hypothetical protein ACOSU4_005201 [Escherichia coli]|uniref:hypothetical protein n=1 Tax=Escherichia coli TaxID=562 RepID=UPI0004DACE80|nr:hypothetical protein [Escherichia coli]EGJ9767306.1 hypothetical protein [Escherichia coli]EGM7726814.1 hypothetical protein [Escherichia coli]KEO25808.1 putative phage DNA replication domain protein [Escherichia coli 5-366-08_S4_C1]
MKNIATGDVLERIRRLAPSHVTAPFKTVAEWREWQLSEGQKRCEEINRQNRQLRVEKILNRSGIQPLHRKCSFSNYQVQNEAQRYALSQAKSIADELMTGCTNFAFSGKPGTGKNHLAAATRGLNKKNSKPTIINKDYSVDTLLSELFLNGAHMEQPNVHNVSEGNMKFYDECHAGLIRPIPAPIGASYDEEITINSPDWQKLACVALRRYQSKECHDGMQWDTTDHGWTDVIAYPFVEEIQSMDNSGYRQCLVGLVTINNSNANSPYLSTVWIHPFYRRRGLLSKLWPKLQELYGSNFEIERPNENMKAFLKSAKHADY